MSLLARSTLAATLALICLLPTCGFALGTEEFGNQELNAANYTLWPGIIPVINDRARVYHSWVNGHEHFKFKGTTAQFNQTLQHFAKIEQIEKREVVLRVGPGKGASFNSEKIFPIDWDLEIIGGISAILFKADQGNKVWSESPVLTVYIGDEFKLHDIVIPAGVTVISPSQLGDRIAEGIVASSNTTVRGWGCGQLADVSPYEELYLQVIGQCLADKDNWVRLNAAVSIAVFGKKAEKYIPQLRELTKSNDEVLENRCEQAIAKIEAAVDTSRAEAKYRVVLGQIDDFVARQNKNAETK